MRLSWLLSLPTLVLVVEALAIEKRDADFLSVRTKLHKDMSGKGGDPKTKYFHESIFHPHYDGRFADKQLGYRERRLALSNLIQTYLATFADIGVETWLMHGTLLGWWWNRKILPWDSDSDVQVSEASMHYLASYYNMTVFHYKTPRIPEGRDYMLEINPHYVNREQSDKMNVIDARWVDTTSGLFIDITTARYNYTHPAGPGMLSCKDGHEYRDSYIFPLRDTFFEGAPAKIPFAYKELLEAEYKEKALTNTDFEGHHFDDQKLEWVPVPKKISTPRPVKAPEPKKEEKKVNSPLNQQGQKTQQESPEQKSNNQQSQQGKSDQQKSSSAQKPDDKKVEKGGTAQGSSSEAPPVAKQGTQPKSSDPGPEKPPTLQKAEDKQALLEQKKVDKLDSTEEKRKQQEEKAAKAKKDRETRDDAQKESRRVKEEELKRKIDAAAGSGNGAKKIDSGGGEKKSEVKRGEVKG